MSTDALQIIQLVVSGIVLPLIGWVLTAVHSVSRAISVAEAWREAHDREMVEIRARVVKAETNLELLRVEFAKCQGGCRK